MGDEITNLDSDNFDSHTQKGKWVVDFWAEWCAPCKMMAPVMNHAAKEFQGRVKFGKLDIESYGDIAEKFEVMSIPTFIIFKDGEPVNRFTGAMQKEDFMEMIDSSFD